MLQRHARRTDWNRWLPPSYADGIPEEGQTQLTAIKEGLFKAYRYCDLHRGAKFWMRSLNDFLDLKYSIPDDEWKPLAQLVFDITLIPDIDLTLQAKWCSLISPVLCMPHPL